jgi:two-component system sensor histidine kinase/response regulator
MTEHTDRERPAILVVDDVEANLVASEALLSELDCEIVKARSGNDALKHLLKREFAVVLLDVQMPEMDGYEVARLARTNPKSSDVPIIFVTAILETEETLFKGYESGAVDVMFKPLNPHILLSKVKVFLELHQRRLELDQEIAAHKRTLAELDAFNYSVSHDLRAPLRPLAGFSRILLEDHGDQLSAEGKEMVGRIASAAERMGRIIDDLLRLSQIGRSRPAPQAVNLAQLASSVVAEIRSSDPTRVVEFVAPAEIKARGDARLLRLALENLLRNAWKFTSKTEHPRIELGVATKTGETAYYVGDNGVGFDPAHADKLFRAFQRLHSNREFEGTGIGLAIVRRVVEHHGGKVWAESGPDRDTCFFFTLG